MTEIQTKSVDAIVKTALDGQDDANGSFDVILSAQTKDRDGDVLKQEDWKTPLPDTITFDVDHGMSVDTLVGSGHPFFNENGDLEVRGHFASTPLAQQVRTLVNEGHLGTTSVAFMSETTTGKDGHKQTVRELLNGSFVVIPSNREAVVLSSKAMHEKAGARNSAADQSKVQTIHDAAAQLGADCGQAKSYTPRPTIKTFQGSLEAIIARAQDALEDAYPNACICLRATLPDALIYDICCENGCDGSGCCRDEPCWCSPQHPCCDHDCCEAETYSQPYTDNGSVIELTGDRTPVDTTEIVVPEADEARDEAAEAMEKGARVARLPKASGALDDAELLSLQARARDAMVRAELTEEEE